MAKIVGKVAEDPFAVAVAKLPQAAPTPQPAAQTKEVSAKPKKSTSKFKREIVVTHKYPDVPKGKPLTSHDIIVSGETKGEPDELANLWERLLLTVQVPGLNGVRIANQQVITEITADAIVEIIREWKEHIHGR